MSARVSFQKQLLHYSHKSTEHTVSTFLGNGFLWKKLPLQKLHSEVFILSTERNVSVLRASKNNISFAFFVLERETEKEIRLLHEVRKCHFE